LARSNLEKEMRDSMAKKACPICAVDWKLPAWAEHPFKSSKPDGHGLAECPNLRTLAVHQSKCVKCHSPFHFFDKCPVRYVEDDAEVEVQMQAVENELVSSYANGEISIQGLKVTNISSLRGGRMDLADSSNSEEEEPLRQLRQNNAIDKAKQEWLTWTGIVIAGSEWAISERNGKGRCMHHPLEDLEYLKLVHPGDDSQINTFEAFIKFGSDMHPREAVDVGVSKGWKLWFQAIAWTRDQFKQKFSFREEWRKQTGSDSEPEICKFLDFLYSEVKKKWGEEVGWYSHTYYKNSELKWSFVFNLLDADLELYRRANHEPGPRSWIQSNVSELPDASGH
jgi:hypothetical protein